MSFSRIVLRPDEKLRVVALENLLVSRVGMMSDFERAGIEAWLTGVEEEFLPLVERHRPHVAVIDLKMNENAAESRGLNYLRAIKDKWPDVRCVVYTAFRNIADFRIAVAASVDGYVVKDAKLSTAEIVKRVADGATLLDAVLMKGAVCPKGADERDKPVTPRHIEIIRLLAENSGATNADIADALGVSSETVKTHVSVILERLGISMREDIVFTARMKGLLN